MAKRKPPQWLGSTDEDGVMEGTCVYYSVVPTRRVALLSRYTYLVQNHHVTAVRATATPTYRLDLHIVGLDSQ